MTNTQVVFVRKNDITVLVSAEGATDISHVKVECLPTTQRMLSNWLSQIYHSLAQQIEQLEEAMYLVAQDN